MTTLIPRPPYSEEEIQKLYPEQLELQFAQILLRHGERAPVSVRFQNAGLPPFWPYCNAAQRMRSVAMTRDDVSKWNSLQWRRRLEQFGDDDGPVIAAGPTGEVDGICQLGELTDKGRETTYALGTRLRHLYVDQLRFMPSLISDADMIYLRSTPLPRALESLQQAFWGMYPENARTKLFPPPTIVTRTPADETLLPNESSCRRLAQLCKAFSQRTADRWNDTDEMKYVNKMLSKWMPEASPKVAVDGHPRLSGVMDTISSTLAHGPATRLPKEFYDEKARAIINKICVEEYFSGYGESREYRTLGIGGLMGDIVERMGAVVESSGLNINEVGGENGQPGKGRGGETKIKFAMSGCHDTTLASMLMSMGAFDGEKWPPFTSHVAVELFKKKEIAPPAPLSAGIPEMGTAKQAPATAPGWLAGMLGLFGSEKSKLSSELSQLNPGAGSSGIARRHIDTLAPSEVSKLDGYFVRLRYNDKIMAVPGCKAAGSHLEGDESFCTMEAFKRIVDDFTPKNWKAECGRNLNGENGDGVPKKKDDVERAGFVAKKNVAIVGSYGRSGVGSTKEWAA